MPLKRTIQPYGTPENLWAKELRVANTTVLGHDDVSLTWAVFLVVEVRAVHQEHHVGVLFDRNTGMAEIGTTTGADILSKYVRDYGFGSETGIYEVCSDFSDSFER